MRGGGRRRSAAADVGRLHERTEGWAAGLRLAAMSLARHAAPDRFVAEFSGSERTVADYLLGEVLAQPAARGPRRCCCARASSSASTARSPTC